MSLNCLSQKWGPVQISLKGLRMCKNHHQWPDGILDIGSVCFHLFPPAECVSRLREEIDSGVMTYLFGIGSKSFTGRVSESSLSLRRRISYRNSFQTVLRARMRPERGGTLISGTCGMHPLVKAFMLVWFGGLALIAKRRVLRSRECERIEASRRRQRGDEAQQCPRPSSGSPPFREAQVAPPLAACRCSFAGETS